MKLMLADDHYIFRQGLISLLSSNKEFQIIGEASNGKEIIDMIKTAAPDIIILDISMPEMNGIVTCNEIKRINPAIKICALSMHKSMSYVNEMVNAGAEGYILKDCAFQELEEGLLKIYEGKNFFSKDLNYSHENRESEVNQTLSPRELEVLQLLSEGNNNKTVAEKLYISVKTVETHRSNIMTKLNLSNLQDLTRYAIQQGFTTL